MSESTVTSMRHVLAGLLSTIDFTPSTRHPEDMLPWADQVVALFAGSDQQPGSAPNWKG